jgi:hypothetical protein
MLHVTDRGCGGDCGCSGCATAAADPAARRAALYALLAAGGWAFESEWAIAVGLGGLIGAVVDMLSRDERSTKNVGMVGQVS